MKLRGTNRDPDDEVTTDLTRCVPNAEVADAAVCLNLLHRKRGTNRLEESKRGESGVGGGGWKCSRNVGWL